MAADKEDVIAAMAPGDLVWMYESETGRDILKHMANGEIKKIKHHRGRGQVVTLAQVVAPPSADNESEPVRYADGTSIWWKWYAPTKTLSSAGRISRAFLNSVLGYKDNYTFRGFGSRHSGLMEVQADVHRELLHEFVSSRKLVDELLLRTAERTAQTRRYGAGESQLHKDIKEKVATQPELVFGEEGLTLVEKEFCFGATGDRIDVLLRDRFGRYVAVEVEPDCGENHLSGPLQCMKYRALIAFYFTYRVEEVRCALVAPSIHESVEKKALSYGIEVCPCQV